MTNHLEIIATNGTVVLIDAEKEDVLYATLANNKKVRLRVSIASNGYPRIRIGKDY